MYTPPVHLDMPQIFPPDVITQSHDEWLYIFLLFQFHPLKIGIIYIYFFSVRVGRTIASTSANLYFNIHMQIWIDKTERNATTLDMKRVHVAIVDSIITIKDLRHRKDVSG